MGLLVETVETLTCLRRMGCQQVQGYLISRPLPPEQSEQLLRTCINETLPLEVPIQGEDSCAPLCRLSSSETQRPEGESAVTGTNYFMVP